MFEITLFVAGNTDYEFFWASPQSSLVVFRQGEFFDVKELHKNTAAGAITAARKFVEIKSDNRKVANA